MSTPGKKTYFLHDSVIVFDVQCAACDAGDLGEEIDNVTKHKCATSLSVSITNGVGCYSLVIVGSVATYQCDEGYSLSGDFQRTCQSNGSWNGRVPQCTGYCRCTDSIQLLLFSLNCGNLYSI